MKSASGIWIYPLGLGYALRDGMSVPRYGTHTQGVWIPGTAQVPKIPQGRMVVSSHFLFTSRRFLNLRSPSRREGRLPMPPVVPPFLIGLITAALVKRLGKPLMRGVVKTSVGLGVEVKRAVHEASEGIQDLAAEATAEMLAAQMAHGTEHNTHTSAPQGDTVSRPGPAIAPAAESGSAESKAGGKSRGNGPAAAKVN
ncbi:DUF5132 domain-containing protein [Streptomyces sp. NPDC088770]|uniref:DUF5132 domain-containing protein n=2 Tax=Streptomyces TaxID=1883 RepID=UPI0037F89CC5